MWIDWLIQGQMQGEIFIQGLINWKYSDIAAFSWAILQPILYSIHSIDPSDLNISMNNCWMVQLAAFSFILVQIEPMNGRDLTFNLAGYFSEIKFKVSGPSDEWKTQEKSPERGRDSGISKQEGEWMEEVNSCDVNLAEREWMNEMNSCDGNHGRRFWSTLAGYREILFKETWRIPKRIPKEEEGGGGGNAMDVWASIHWWHMAGIDRAAGAAAGAAAVDRTPTTTETLNTDT